ncbi:MAG: YgiQ family radical SAM protein [Victivallales bacterium]
MTFSQSFPLPMTRHEMQQLGWNELDVLLVSGDAYVDHPSFGIAIIGRILLSKGFRVGIVAQPDWKNPDSLKSMGRPRLACAASAGNLDSMLNIHTAARRIRKEDSYSPGGRTGLRPAHATVVYSQLARQAFPGIPVIIGGIEASLRRFTHYDYWQDKMRPSILSDSKADILVYGMGERAIIEIIERISKGKPLDSIKGTARILGKNAAEDFRNAGKPGGSSVLFPRASERSPGTDPGKTDALQDFLKSHSRFVELPSYEQHLASKDALMESVIKVEREMNPYCAKALVQRHGDRLVLQEPPAPPLSTEELDEVYALPFTNKPHPSYKEQIPAYEMIRNSVTAVRGCPGGCSFCGLGIHQGKFVTSRSRNSIVCEIRRLAEQPGFKGTVSDVGGPTANTYGSKKRNPELCRECRRPSCLFPEICHNFYPYEEDFLSLLAELDKLEKVKHVFIGSGLRLDLAVLQNNLMRKIVRDHVSGQLKVAPEHLDDAVLKLMRKNKSADFFKFLEIFNDESSRAGKKQFIVPYFISNFPGATEAEMKKVDDFLSSKSWTLQQVQDFIPLPMTLASAMYYCGKSPDGKPLAVNRGLKERRPQMKMLKKKRQQCDNLQKSTPLGPR